MSLSYCHLEHWYIFLYKAILNDLPLYLCSLLIPEVVTISSCSLQSNTDSLWCSLDTTLVKVLLVFLLLHLGLNVRAILGQFGLFWIRMKEHLWSLWICFSAGHHLFISLCTGDAKSRIIFVFVAFFTKSSRSSPSIGLLCWWLKSFPEEDLPLLLNVTLTARQNLLLIQRLSPPLRLSWL